MFKVLLFIILVILPITTHSDELKTQSLKLNGSSSGYVDQKAPASPTSYTFTWPSTQASGAQSLQNDGSGNLSWVTVPTGAANTSLSNLISTAINQDLLSAANNTKNIGSHGNIWSQGFYNSLVSFGDIKAGNDTVNYSLLTPTTVMPDGSSVQGALTAEVAIGTNASGSLGVYTENNSTVDASATGSLKLETGNKTAGTGDSGDILLRSGTSSGGTRGSIFFNSFAKFSNSLSSNWGDTDGLEFNLGSGAEAAIESQDSSVNAFTTNGLALLSGAHTGVAGTGATGRINIYTGDILGGAAGPSGDISVHTGQAGSGTTGNMDVQTGQSSTGSSGVMQFTTGSAGGGNSGNIELLVGTATGTRGSVTLDGKTVSMFSKKIIFDPTFTANEWGAPDPTIYSGTGDAFNIMTPDVAVDNASQPWLNIFTGDNTAVGAANSPGGIEIISGSITDATSTADTSPTIINSGYNNGTGKSGGMYGASGSTLSGDSGAASWKSGDVAGNGHSGLVSLKAGNCGASSGACGDARVEAGQSTGNADSGAVIIGTQQSTGGNTGGIFIATQTTTASPKNSGPIQLTTGAASNISGGIDIKAGNGTNAWGDVTLRGTHVYLQEIGGNQHKLGFIVPSNGSLANYDITWPANQGSAGSILTNNGSGILSWGNGISIVKMRYHNATATVTGADSKVTYSTSDYDSDSAYSSGVFTVPTGKSGNYHIGAQLDVLGTFAVNNFVQLAIYYNGVLYSRTSVSDANASNNGFIVHIEDDIQAVATDTIEIRVSSDATTPTVNSSDSLNFLNIHLNGN